MLENNGIKVTLLPADASTDKLLGNPYQDLTEEAISSYRNELNSVNNTFISAVKKGRGDKLKSGENVDLFTGKVFNGADAVKYGLADKAGVTLNESIKSANFLVKK